jgi:hypothetical protein
MEILAALVAAGMQYQAGRSSDRKQKKIQQKERAVQHGRADFMRKWLHPEQRVALAEQNVGAGGGLVDERRARLGDAQALELAGSQANLDASKLRSDMMREQLRNQQYGNIASAASGMAGLLKPSPVKQDPYQAFYGRPTAGGYRHGMFAYDNGG